MTYAEVAEGVRATIAAYCHALDDGRTDDVVGLFCEDGSATIPGAPTLEGRDAIREGYKRWTPRGPQRHLVLNTRVTEWTDDAAHAVSDLVFLAKGETGWAIQLVGRYADELHHVDGTWLLHSRTLTAADGP